MGVSLPLYNYDPNVQASSQMTSNIAKPLYQLFTRLRLAELPLGLDDYPAAACAGGGAGCDAG